MIYYFESEVGCGIREAYHLQSAKKQIREEIGTYFDLYFVRKATEEDIEWVAAVGGWLPKGVQDKRSRDG